MRALRRVGITFIVGLIVAMITSTPAWTEPGKLPQCTKAANAAFAKINKCTPVASYRVEDTAIVGVDPSSGTLTIACRQGFVLGQIVASGVNPTGYQGVLGSFTSSIPANDYEAGVSRSTSVSYALAPDAPAGHGLSLAGTCTPAA